MDRGHRSTREGGGILWGTNPLYYDAIRDGEGYVLVAPPAPLLPRRRLHLPVGLHDVAEGRLVRLVEHVLCAQERLEVRALLVDEGGLCAAVPDADGRLGRLEGEHDAADLCAVPVEGLRDDLAHDAPPEVDAALPRDGDGPAPPVDVGRVLPQRLDALAEELDARLLREDGKVAEDPEVPPELGEAPDGPDVPDGAGAGRGLCVLCCYGGDGVVGGEWLVGWDVGWWGRLGGGEMGLGGAGWRGGFVDPPDPGTGKVEGFGGDAG